MVSITAKYQEKVKAATQDCGAMPNPELSRAIGNSFVDTYLDIMLKCFR